MEEIAILKNDETYIYNVFNIPFSEEELNRKVKELYHDMNCERCFNAVYKLAFARLLMEIEEEDISKETVLIFPIIKDSDSLTIIKK
ncbi:MAG: hypothetical protein RR306_05805 [Clostridia bacterium]